MNIKNKTKLRCNLCGSRSAKQLFIKNGCHIVKCLKCSLVYVYPQPSKEFLKEYYTKQMFNRGNKYDYNIKKGKPIYSERTNDIDKVNYVRKFQKKGKLLDVGCAKGFFVFLAKRAFDASGVEYSGSAVKTARKLGLNVVEGEIQDVKNGKYDVITMWDVIEHVKDPSSTLKQANTLLKKNGYLFITTGDSNSLIAKASLKNWTLMNPPGHLYYFSKETIKQLLAKQGFDVVEIKYFSKKMEIRWVLFKLADTTNNKLLSKIYNLVRDTRIGKRRLRVNSFDIMTVVAIKKQG